MRQVFTDLETFWSKTHSLSKMSPIAYCLHPDTELISASFQEGVDGEPFCVFGEDEIRRAVADLRLDKKTMLIGHNMSGFDSMIFAWRLGVRPGMWGCTLAMARPIHAKDVGLSLAKLVAHYKLGVKDAAVLHQTQGRNLADFTQEERASMAVYNSADVSQCAQLFLKLLPHYTTEELWHLDCNIRMLVQPKFIVDKGLLETAASVERSNKLKALHEVARHFRESVDGGTDWPMNWSDTEAVEEFVRSEMASQQKFAKLLERQGVEVPMKPSPTNPNNLVPALAKSDEAFVALTEHEDELVAAAALARLAVKSTITETRIEAFIETASLVAGRLPVPLNYCGADTTGRDSGWLYNPQNLSRINKKKPRPADALRRCLRARPGYVIGVADQSGIELRMNHSLWKVPSTMELYAKDPKADLYKDLAAWYYQVPPDEVTPEQRQMAKVMHLGLGFGSGFKTFMRIARLMGGLKLDEAAAENAVNGWRQRYPEIVQGWKSCGSALYAIAERRADEALDPWGLVTTHPDGLCLPSGRMIRYPGLRYELTDQTWPDGRPKDSWVYGQGRHKAFLTGPKVDENIVQALARDSVFECALRFYKVSRLRPIMRVHDELIYEFPKSEATDLLDTLQQIMRTPPSWFPHITLWSEGDIAEAYGDAK